MRTATFISIVFGLFFALLGVVHALPEPVQVGSILAREVEAIPAKDGLSGLVARGDDDDDHHGGKGDDDHYGDDYCWKKDGWSKCGKDNSCCKKYQTCCGGNKCCDKGYKCVRKDKDYDDDHHKRGDDDDHHGDDDHYGYGYYEWYCKKDGHGW